MSEFRELSKKAKPLQGLRQQPLIEPLTPREMEVLQWLAQGASNQVISQNLVLSIDTVKRHISNIFSKMGVSNWTQAVIQARALGLLGEEP